MPMQASGDEDASSSESAHFGVKGSFLDTIVSHLRSDAIQLAVHSAKDLPVEDDPDLPIVAVLERLDPFDVLVSRTQQLPAGAVVGTSSLRRQAQLRADSTLGWDVRNIRGNVDTRLRKLDSRAYDGIVIAAAGLLRLGVTPTHTRRLDLIPAPGQGALAVQARVGSAAAALAARLDDPPTRRTFEAERTLVRLIGADCALPLGAYATVAGNGDVALEAVVASLDGRRVARATVQERDPGRAARVAAEVLRANGAMKILAELAQP